MSFPSDITALTCLFIGFFLLVFCLWSRIIKENFYLSDPILCTLFGILLSDKGLGMLIYVPRDWDRKLVHSQARDSLMWLCRIIIGAQVLFLASTLPSGWLGQRKNMQSMMVLLLPVMTVGWLVSGILAKACFPSMLWTEAFIIGACIAPTDPVLASSVVKGTFAERNVPAYVRQLIAAESGLNDGFGTPFLFIPIFAVLYDTHFAEAARAFFLETALYDVVFGSLLGVGIGYAARKRLKVAQREEQIDRESILIFSLALTLFTVGLGQVLKTNSLLACFFAGIAVNWTDTMGPEILHSPFNEGAEILFDAAVFLVLGVILPIDTWLESDFLPLPRLILLSVSILLLRRLPAVILMYKFIPNIHTKQQAVFTGYFGPIGVSALYYALVATERLPDDYTRRSRIIATTTFIIFSSIIVHGASAPLYLLGKGVAARFGSKRSVFDLRRDRGHTRNDYSGETAPLLVNEGASAPS